MSSLEQFQLDDTFHTVYVYLRCCSSSIQQTQNDSSKVLSWVPSPNPMKGNKARLEFQVVVISSYPMRCHCNKRLQFWVWPNIDCETDFSKRVLKRNHEQFKLKVIRKTNLNFFLQIQKKSSSDSIIAVRIFVLHGISLSPISSRRSSSKQRNSGDSTTLKDCTKH